MPDDSTRRAVTALGSGTSIRVTGDWGGALRAKASTSAFTVDTFTTRGASAADSQGVAPQAVLGSVRWLVLACRVANAVIVNQNPVPFYTQVLGPSFPAIGAYWPEVSYNKVNLTGSAAAGWFDLPGGESKYWPNGVWNLQATVQDCTTAADTAINFDGYDGIVFVSPTPGAQGRAGHFGGYYSMTLEGRSRLMHAAWVSSEVGCVAYGCGTLALLAHEMAHGYGLPHSAGPYGDTYGSWWDVVSGGSALPSQQYHNPPGSHLIAYHKHRLGWIDPPAVFDAPLGTSVAAIDSIDALPSAGAYTMARVPAAGASYYTVEARRRVGFDGGIPGDAVIIHHVDQSRIEPAWVMDGQNTDPNKNANDHEAQWVPGETFYDTTGAGLMIEVTGQTARGWSVKIVRGTAGVMNKTAPLTGTTRIDSSVTLSWTGQPVPTTYAYCLDTTNNSSCDSGWVDVGTQTSVVASHLMPDTTYFWHVRATQNGSTFYSNGASSEFWSFTTVSARDDNYATPWGTDLRVPAPGVLLNDGAPGATARLLTTSGTGSGTVTLDPDGGFVFAPANFFFGPFTFTYLATSPNGTTTVGMVTITVQKYGDATAMADVYFTSTDTALSVPAPGVTSNDVVDVGTITSVAIERAPQRGTVALSAGGGFVYVPQAGFTGFDRFTYRATVGAKTTNAATVVIGVVDATTLLFPTNLSARSIAGNQITLRWTPPGATLALTGYVLEGGVTPGQTLAAIPTGSTQPVMTLTAPNGAFYLRVKAIGGGQTSAASNEIRVFVNQPVAPSAPSHLTGLTNGSQVGLSWRNTFAGGTPSSLTLDVTGTLSGSLPLGPVDTFSFPAMPPGTYTFSVRASNAFGSSASSNAVTLTFPNGCTGAPQVPENFLAYAAGNVLNLAWDPAGSGAATTSYVLNVSGPVNVSVPWVTRGLSVPVGPGSYTFSIAAVNSCGTSAATVTQTVVVP